MNYFSNNKQFLSKFSSLNAIVYNNIRDKGRMEKRGNDFSLTPHFASLDNKIKLFNIIPRFNINFSASFGWVVKLSVSASYGGHFINSASLFIHVWVCRNLLIYDHYREMEKMLSPQHILPAIRAIIND